MISVCLVWFSVIARCHFVFADTVLFLFCELLG